MTDSKMPEFHDYDAGLLNDYGGGDVAWWQDYIRAEIGRANDFWRDQVSGLVHPAPTPDARQASHGAREATDDALHQTRDPVTAPAAPSQKEERMADDDWKGEALIRRKPTPWERRSMTKAAVNALSREQRRKGSNQSACAARHQAHTEIMPRPKGDQR